MVSKSVILGVLSVLVIIQFLGFIYLYTSPRATNSSNSESVRYVLVSKTLNLARRTLGLNGSNSGSNRRSKYKPKLSHNAGVYKSKNDTKSLNISISLSSSLRINSSSQDVPPHLSSSTGNIHLLATTKKNTSLPLSLSHRSSTNTSASNDTKITTTVRHTWEFGSFCYDFLEHTFHDAIPACGPKALPHDSIKCYGNTLSKHMARCALENVAVRPSKLATALFEADSVKLTGREDVIQLLDDKETSCAKPSSKAVADKMEDGDYIRLMINSLTKQKTIPSSVCEKWIDKTAFLFTAHPYHIYFRFLDYYNLHKALSDYSLSEEEYDIIRVSTGKSEYHYQDFERKLYPNVIHISDLPNVVTCYRRVVLVPKSYASTLFQCKMHWGLKDHCMICDGKGLVDTDLQTFRQRVLKSCSLDDTRHHHKSDLVLISRKPYKREPKDELKKFERVLSNENDLINGIKSTYPSTNVLTVHLEDLTVCDQVAYANQADVLLAVHGAGLVHLWWLREDAVAVEMEPHYEAGNPSFKVLSRLTGRRYYSHFIGGGWGTVNVNVNDMLSIISKHGNLH